MSGFRPELHVAQQSRRDKLRVHQTSSPPHHLDSEKLPIHPGLNPDIVHVRNVRNANLLYDPTVFSSEMLNFSINTNALSGQGSGESENFGNWRSLNPPQSLDWVTNYTSGSVGSGSNNQNHMFGSRESNNNMSPSTPHLLKPSSFHGYQDVQSSLANQSAEISSHHVSQKHLGTMHFSSPPLNYLNTLQDVVTSASTGAQDQLEMASLVQQRIMENELVLLPSYVNQSNTLRFDNASSNSWMNRQPVENRHHWSSGGGGGMGFSTAKNVDEDMRNGMNNDSNQQGLSLSLSSNPPSNNKLPAAQFGSQDLHASSHDDHAFKDVQSPKTGKSSADYLCSIAKPSIISKACGKSLQDIVGTSTSACRSTGPLGPFTGYATILKSSKFLKPAQQLLDEFCRNSDSKLTKTREASERMSGDVSASASVSVSTDAANAVETEAVTKGNNSGASSSTFYGSNEITSDGGAASISSGSFGPEYQQKKAKLLYMQEEVSDFFSVICPLFVNMVFI